MNYLSLLKGKSLGQILRGLYKLMKNSYSKFLLYISRPPVCGVSGNKELRVIVSLTSFPQRIKEVHLCVKTLLNQSYKPDAVILWLAEEQFPNREKDLPVKLLKLRNNGLTIAWCSDLRSYKKLIPAIKKFPEAVIITTDDDVYYKHDWLYGLITAHKQYPTEVLCYRAAKIGINDNGELIREHPMPGIEYGEATYLHQQTGVGGVVYPPHSLYKDIIREDIFMDIAKTNDDLWFWMMGILNGTKIRILEHNTFSLYYVGESQLYSLTSINDSGEKLYDVQLNSLLEKYPLVLQLLKQEHHFLVEGDKD